MTFCRVAAGALVASVLAVFSIPAAVAQTYPDKPITMIVPWPAGGSTDVAMRAISEAAAKHLGQPIVVDNKPGASGTLGPAIMAANAKPDGYTIAQMPITVMRLPLMQKTTWDAVNDFTYVAHLTGYTFGITTSAENQFKTWKDVVDYAKANPGKVTYASPGAGTSLHIGMEQIAAAAGVQLTHVPFKGGAETNAAVLGGHTTLQADSTGWKPLVDGGKLRLLAIWTGERSKNWPNTPDAEGARLSLRVRFPVRHRRTEGHEPGRRRQAARRLQEGRRGLGVIATLAKYDMVPRYMDTATYRKFVDEIIAGEKAALEKIGLAKKS